MAVTATRVQTGRPMGSDYYTISTVACDSSYQSEGEPLTPRELGLRRVTFAICNILNGDEAAESELFVGLATYTPATEKLHLINLKSGKEVSSTKKMEKVVVQVVAFGKP